MVEAAKKRGCDVCRKRHIKCDRISPSCNQCIRAGWTCPGYPADLSFVNYSQTFPTGRVKTVITKGREIRPAEDPKSRTDSSSLSRDRPNESLRKAQLVPAAKTRTITPIPIAPATAGIDVVRQQFVWAFEQQSLPAKFETLTLDPYLKYIPQQLGRSKVLDDAVRFLALASCLPPEQRDLSKQKEPNKQLLTAYGASVRGLADAIGDLEQVGTSPTLAATLLFQLYETWCSQDNPRRAMHANAVAQLIEYRGPECFNDEFDVAILEAEIANALFSSLRAGKCCFLATPAWSKVITEISKDKYNGPGRYDTAQLHILNIWTYLPGAIAGFHDFLLAMSTTAPLDVNTAESPSDTVGTGTPPSLISDSRSDEPSDRSSPPSAHESDTPHPSPFSSSTHTHPHPSSFGPLTHYITALLTRLQAWRAAHLPVVFAELAHITAAGGPLYEMVCEIGSATMIAMCCYMLATITPATDPEQKAAAEGYYVLAKSMMEIVERYYRRAPNHPFFASGGTRNSLKFAWVRAREDRVGERRGVERKGDLRCGGRVGVSEVSERIAGLLNVVYANS